MMDPNTAQIENPIQHGETSSREEVFVEIYEKYWDRLFDVAYKRLQDKEVAEEIIQEIFTDLWEKQGIDNIRNPENYLMTAVKFAVIDHIRHKTARKNYLEYHKNFLAGDSVQQHILDHKDYPKLLEEGMTKLSETSKSVFFLNQFHNWKKERIAEYFQLSEKAIEYHLAKSLKTVKMHLKNISF
jgi:RNA polymerase sigma factor (sigma-70 family)